MHPVQQYKSEFTQKTYDTPDACLKDEFEELQASCLNHVRCLMLLDGVSIDHQLDTLFPKLKRLREKGREWKTARDARIDAGELPPTAALVKELHERDEQQQRIKAQLTRIAKRDAQPPTRESIADSETRIIENTNMFIKHEEKRRIAEMTRADPGETPAENLVDMRRAA